MADFKKSGSDEFKKKITVSGMPESCYDQVTFENFKSNQTPNENARKRQRPRNRKAK